MEHRFLLARQQLITGMGSSWSLPAVSGLILLQTPSALEARWTLAGGGAKRSHRDRSKKIVRVPAGTPDQNSQQNQSLPAPFQGACYVVAFPVAALRSATGYIRRLSRALNSFAEFASSSGLAALHTLARPRQLTRYFPSRFDFDLSSAAFESFFHRFFSTRCAS